MNAVVLQTNMPISMIKPISQSADSSELILQRSVHSGLGRLLPVLM